ncbi:hypothetical protein [uncultured Psychroserpens sp.]|uniref:hypothetical protein n=1 Tax=uncultured Psychroserpens sp. TaxID=255436 RepID=UPI0026339D18|nr:hypothetical protein [uncultured Psychroserpens sp.]
MKYLAYSLIFVFTITVHAQYEYDASEKHPYGQPNPEAPEQVKDFEAMIGTCNCKSTTRKQDGTWNDTEDMIWRWKYIMNGTAVQDETLKADGAHTGSIRQFVKDSSRWYVHFFSTKFPTTSLPTWEGNKTKDNKIILYRESKAPNGMDGFYRLTFYDMSKTGYKWAGEWVDTTEKIVYPTWKIECTRSED